MNSILNSMQNGNSGFYIKPVIDSSKSKTKDPYFPFQIINDSTPFIRVVHAKIVTDIGCDVKSVVIFMQKDGFLENKAITNNDINECWQKFYTDFSLFSDHAFLTLSFQTHSDKSLIPCEPLLYCIQLDKFFHPPCPICGQSLFLCTDDSILSSVGLENYYKSSTRYLYCKTCNPSNVYTFIKSDNEHPLVKDTQSLIKSYKNIDQSCKYIPCNTCPLREQCLSTSLYISRIKVFSLYPFYMLILNDSFEHCNQWISLSILYFMQLLTEKNKGFSQLYNTIQTDMYNRRSNRIIEKEKVPNTESLLSSNKKLYGMISNIQYRWQNQYNATHDIRTKDISIQSDDNTNPADDILNNKDNYNSSEKETSEWDEIPTTKIISPEKHKQTKNNIINANSEWDEIPATTIISPEKHKQTKNKKVNANSEWDEIPATMIISPEKYNGSKNNKITNDENYKCDENPATNNLSTEKLNHSHLKENFITEKKSEWDIIPPTSINKSIKVDSGARKNDLEDFVTETITL